MKSVMTHQFSQVPKAEIQRSSFDRSHGYKTTFDAGYLVPVFVDEVLPGDSMSLNMTAFARLATPMKPVMDNMFLDTFFFAIPYRLVWDNWQKFCGEQATPGASTDYLVPQMTAPAGGGVAVGSLSDYFGIPTGIDGLKFNSLFHRSYNLVWNSWFRDQNLQTPVMVETGDGPDTYNEYTLRRRAKRHDYFTSCLPWAQKGPSTTVPLGTSAPVISNNEDILLRYALDPNNDQVLKASPTSGQLTAGSPASQQNIYWGSESGLIADLSGASPATINQLRQSFAVQRMYERDARGGTRYYEVIKSHFGVTDPGHAVLQRPVYLGGGSTPINIHPVPQTSGSPATTGYTDTPQGNLAAYGTAGVMGHGFSKSFTEHCLILGLANVRADINYQNGLNKMFSRRTRFDFYWPALSHIGEQPVKNSEIYAQGTSEDDLTFGFQEAYADYRYKPSQITGQFRSSYSQSLDLWHLALDFSALPLLDGTFIQDNPPIARVVAVPTEPHILFDAYFNYKCARPMPVYGVPGMIDHF